VVDNTTLVVVIAHNYRDQLTGAGISQALASSNHHIDIGVRTAVPMSIRIAVLHIQLHSLSDNDSNHWRC